MKLLTKIGGALMLTAVVAVFMFVACLMAYAFIKGHLFIGAAILLTAVFAIALFLEGV